MENYAVINIGSLKVKSLVASFDGAGKITPQYKSNELTCFGCAMYENNGNVLDSNLEKTIQEILKLKNIIKKYDCKETRLFATHALRSAKNRDFILKAIKKRTGLGSEIISPEEEGELYFQAVVNDFQDNGNYAVCDIGGGSCQILVGNKEKILENYSFPTGIQFLHEKFTENPHNPGSFTTKENLAKVGEWLDSRYAAIKSSRSLPLVYGSSNIIDLLKTLKIPLEPLRGAGNHPYKTRGRSLKDFISHIVQFPHGERDRMYPFQIGYMWGVDKAFLNILALAQKFNSPYIIPTNNSVLDGFLYKMREER